MNDVRFKDELEKTYSAWKLGRDVRDDANRRRSTLSNSQVFIDPIAIKILQSKTQTKDDNFAYESIEMTSFSCHIDVIGINLRV